MQGPIEPAGDEPLGPYSHTLSVTQLGPWWEPPTCSIRAPAWSSAAASTRPGKRHPRLRGHLTARVFWIPNHWWLVRAAIALALPRRLWWVRWWLGAPYVLRLGTLRPDVAAFLVAHDLVEMAACARGSLRHRVLVL